jgi:hypothetical protein
MVQRKLAQLGSELPVLDADISWPGRRAALSSDHRFQQPQLLQLMLEDILGLRNIGRGEKTAWEIRFGYRGAFCVTAFRKFGLRLEAYSAEMSDSELDNLLLELVELLADAAKLVERHVFQDFVADQVNVGAVGVENQLSRLRAMYMYFRELTEAVHTGAGKLADLPSSREVWVFPAQTEGFYTTVAMVNAYFSYLEHLFVLMLPFSRFDGSKESVVSFIGSSWGEKYKRIISPARDVEGQRFHQRLRTIAEEFRNTHVHGGFNKNHGGLIVHCSAGALRADIKGRRRRPYFELVPVDETDFEHIRATFDEFDAWLAPSYGLRWAVAGLNVSFDAASVAAYAAATSSDDEFEALLEGTARLEDQYANMDW